MQIRIISVRFNLKFLPKVVSVVPIVFVVLKTQSNERMSHATVYLGLSPVCFLRGVRASVS